MTKPGSLDQTPTRYIREVEMEDTNEKSISEIEKASDGLSEEVRQAVKNWCTEARGDLTRVLPPWDELDAIVEKLPEDRNALIQACPDYAEFADMEPIEDEEVVQTDVRAKVEAVDPGYKGFLKQGA